MSQIAPDTIEGNTPPHPFHDRKVDNDDFFQTIEEKLPSILSSTEIRQQTHLELQTLLMDMKQRTFIRGVTEWTALEQRNFFEKIQAEMHNVGSLASVQIREKIQTLIEDEIWREINDDGKKYSLQDGDGNTMISNMGEYQRFLDTSFLITKETSIIPLDLRLTISKDETVVDAKKKLERYRGKYNALILVDSENRPMGIVRHDMLQKQENAGNPTLNDIDFIPGIFGYYTTSSDDARLHMQEHGINILPIIDSKTGILIGILTSNSLAKKEVQYYSATSLTELSLEYLKMGT